MFKPVNRHILIDMDQRTDEQKSLIVLPEDYKPVQQKHSVVSVLNKFDLKQGSKIIVDSSMIDEIVVENTTYNVILENYVVGVLTP